MYVKQPTAFASGHFVGDKKPDRQAGSISESHWRQCRLFTENTKISSETESQKQVSVHGLTILATKSHPRTLPRMWFTQLGGREWQCLGKERCQERAMNHRVEENWVSPSLPFHFRPICVWCQLPGVSSFKRVLALFSVNIGTMKYGQNDKRRECWVPSLVGHTLAFIVVRTTKL